MKEPILDKLLRRDRLIVLGGLAGITILSWAYMLHEARAMQGTGVCQCLGMKMSGPDTQPWSPAALLPLFLMWVEMMIAMMVPTVAPMILTFATVNRRRCEQKRPFVPTSIFLAGYLVVWTVFSAGIALAQWALHATALLSPMMASQSAWLAGGLLVAAGVFQFTPWKNACLQHCRSPLDFLMAGWQEGWSGAFAMGARHGAYCTGCCWFLMALLFVLGVMNILWIAAITALVLLEKTLPRGKMFVHSAGVALLVWGMWLLIHAATTT
jgi:predicted metal-binding membrane protein